MGDLIKENLKMMSLKVKENSSKKMDLNIEEFGGKEEKMDCLNISLQVKRFQLDRSGIWDSKKFDISFIRKYFNYFYFYNEF